ncbi:Abscission/NoCut checkpoint regulator [Plecturocebus cupreus]
MSAAGEAPGQEGPPGLSGSAFIATVLTSLSAAFSSMPRSAYSLPFSRSLEFDYYTSSCLRGTMAKASCPVLITDLPDSSSKPQYGCKNCGRAFCSGCLSFSAAVPRTGNTQQKVCKQCHEVLTRRVAALEAKQKSGTSQSQGLTQDQIIAERLARLRQENKPSEWGQAEIEARLAALKDERQGSIPSTQEMEARLAALQGRVPPSQTPQPVSVTASERSGGTRAHHTPDTRMQAQQTQDLLTQLAAEVAIDESWKGGGPAASLQNDLNQGGPGSTNSKGPASWSLEEEKSRLLAEAALELREENTRQERILTLAKRLAVLRGQDPKRGEGWGAAAHWCPWVKASLTGLSEVLVVPVPRDLLSPAQSHKDGGGAKQWDYHLPDSDDDEDEETAIQRVLQQLTEEAALDEASGFNIPVEPASQPRTQPRRVEPEAQDVDPRPEAEEEELPWCCICNEDATLRCAGCDGDLFCARCFRWVQVECPVGGLKGCLDP